MYRIGEFSKLCGLSVDALYHYQKMEILIPNHVDKNTGYRYYEAKQLLTINKILALKDTDFTLEEIAEILHKTPSMYSLTELFEWIYQNGYEKKGSICDIYHQEDFNNNDFKNYSTECQATIE